MLRCAASFVIAAQQVRCIPCVFERPACEHFTKPFGNRLFTNVLRLTHTKNTETIINKNNFKNELNLFCVCYLYNMFFICQAFFIHFLNCFFIKMMVL